MLLGPHMLVHFYSYLLKVPYHGPGLSLSTKVIVGNKKRPQSLPFRESAFTLGFIHLSPTAHNSVKNFTFKNVFLLLQLLKVT